MELWDGYNKKLKMVGGVADPHSFRCFRGRSAIECRRRGWGGEPGGWSGGEAADGQPGQRSRGSNWQGYRVNNRTEDCDPDNRQATTTRSISLDAKKKRRMGRINGKNAIHF